MLVLSLVTLAVYMSASEVEVGKCVPRAKTRNRIPEGAETALSLAFPQQRILCLPLVMVSPLGWRKLLPGFPVPHLETVVAQEASYSLCALRIPSLKHQVRGDKPNANRILCLFYKSFKDLLVRKKRLVVLFSHWLLHAYGIISISKLDKLEQDLPLLALVPAPALFYLLTAKYTEPSRILSEGGNGH